MQAALERAAWRRVSAIGTFDTLLVPLGIDVMGALRPGQQATAGQLLDHTEASLARFKRPREVFIEPSLPKNPVGKIDKPALRDKLREQVKAAP